MPINPTGFSPATVIKSAEVNDNFTEIATILNGLRPQVHMFLPDVLVVAANVTTEITIRSDIPLYFSTVNLRAKTAPTGAAIVINIKKNGTTIFTSKPQIAAGATTGGGSAVFAGSNPSVTDGDVLTVDIDQVGSTEPGRNVSVSLAFNL